MDNVLVQPDLLTLPATQAGRKLSVPSANLEVAKALVTAGVPYEHIAKQLGVERSLIKVWANRYDWITPTKIERRMREELIQSEGVNGGENSDVTNSKPADLDPLTIAVEHAKKVGMSAMAGFVQRAAPSFNKLTPGS